MFQSIQSSFGWHILKVIDLKNRKEIKYSEIKDKFKTEILLEKGAVFDLQDELEDLLLQEVILKKYQNY